MHDLVIRGGTVADGTDGPAYTADVAVEDGRIVAVGRVSGSAQGTINADALLITPGFVDIHTQALSSLSLDNAGGRAAAADSFCRRR